MGEETCPKCKGFGEIERRGKPVPCPECNGEGYVLVCDYCGKPATRETPVSGVYLCDNEECWLEFVSNECQEL